MLDLGKVAATAGQRLAALSDLSEDVHDLSERVTALDRTIQQSFVTKSELEDGYPTYKELDARIKAAQNTAATAVRKLRRRTIIGALGLVAVVTAGYVYNRNAAVQADYETCLRSNVSRDDIRDTFVDSSENLIAAYTPADGSAPSPRLQAVIDSYRADTLEAVQKFAPRDCGALYPAANHKES